MTEIVAISALQPPADGLYVSRGMRKCIERDGLITPLVFMRDGVVHHSDAERYKAFVERATALGAEGSKTVILVWHDQLTEADLEDL